MYPAWVHTNQNGFWRNSSTFPQILTICWIIKRVCTKNLEATLLFIDFFKAIDSIQRLLVLYFDPRPGLKMLFQGDTPEGSNTFQRPVIKRDRVGGLRLMIWDKVKVSLCHYSHAPEESNLWTAWQLFPLDDD